MATAAHAVPGFVASAADDMDLLSDSGLDFTDGDIELDLEPPPPRQDDDVSINDAASVGGLDTQTAFAEQDDFMADNEDLIEEDYGYQGDDGVVFPDQPSTSNTAAARPLVLAQVDDDLIDYSDEDDEPPQQLPVSSVEHDTTEGQYIQAKHSTEQQDDIPADLQALMSGSNTNIQSQSPNSDGQNGIDHTKNHRQSPSYRSHHSGYDEEEVHTDSNHGSVQLQGQQEFADGNEHGHDHKAHEDYNQAYSADDNEHQDYESFELPSVTVNYEGSELWLFKQHDHDDSGDWLIEDLALAKSSMSDLFQACRSSFGNAVSNESEIGFRFDHLHNMELYEDNTACVAVSLERLVGLYHTLQSQDGNNEPESFYISILFRPRFLTLLSDVAKYAEQGSGSSVLDAAVAAGETHFANMISNASTDEPTKWGNEEQQEADGEELEHVADEAQPDQDKGYQNDLGHDNTQGEEGEHQEEGADVHDEEENPVEPVRREGSGRSDVDDDFLQTANTGNVPTEEQEAGNQPDEHRAHSQSEIIPESEARRLQKEDDLIDYSDEEDEEPVNAEGKKVPANQPSPSSTTVYGGEPANAEEDGSALDLSHIDDEDNHDLDEVGFGAGDVPDAHSTHDQAEAKDDTEHPYQDYAQAVDDEANGAEQFSVDVYDGDANQDYAGFEYQTLDQQLELDLMNGDESNDAGNTTTTGNDFADTDDFLYLDNAAEWDADRESVPGFPDDAIIVHDNAHLQDEEDGVAEQPANAASSAADRTTASSDDAKNVSPQGQKRSIDEAGHGADNALDSIGMLVRFPGSKRTFSADFYPLDAKRLRV
ncbi:hypothetical protein EJ02DRAFT_511330 [Clathrospora elynae]|uniref:Uncharacterized protein n=1 Tax=Clathrospora elynae TaxID=706981 RepID=A0A6A5ST46_9PLEO|nr:hypothetical protein EJ02DRAFT_511330 [Clathrospora elynae]